MVVEWLWNGMVNGSGYGYGLDCDNYYGNVMVIDMALVMVMIIDMIIWQQ